MSPISHLRTVSRLGTLLLSGALAATALLPSVATAAPGPFAGASITVRTSDGEGAAAARSSRQRDWYRIPEAALVRPLGKIIPGACTGNGVCDGKTPEPIDAATGGFPLAIPGLGIPLGGVGAGSFMINQSGTFGPWNFGGQEGSSWETRALEQAAFHVREKIGTAPVRVRTLATKGPTTNGSQGPVPERSWESPLKAWNILKPGQADYGALFPFGWMQYKPFKTDVSMRFYSPIIAREERRTSMPVAYFDVRIANHTNAPADMAVMFTMPNAPGSVEGNQTDPTVPQPSPAVRKGFSSRYRAANGIKGVTLSANSNKNSFEAKRSEWTLAARPQPGQRITYTPSWNAKGSGADVYAPFKRTGALPNKPIAKGATAGAVSVQVKLAPGEVATIPFALAWDFPMVAFKDRETVWMRRYTNFYGARNDNNNEYVKGSYAFNKSFEIAQDALLARAKALRDVQRWWNPLALSKSYPRKLRTAALNQLSLLTFQNSFWEGGLVKNDVISTTFESNGPGQHLAAYRNAHLFGVQDTGAGGQSGMGRTTDIQNYNYLGYFKLFPQLFKGTLLASAEATERMPNNNAPDLYVNAEKNSPFMFFGNTIDSPVQGGTDSREPIPGVTQWGDSPSKHIFEWFAYAKMTKDKKFLEKVWPAVQHEIEFLRAIRAPGTHLPLDSTLFANMYNGYPQPAQGIYNSQLSLLAFASAIAAGKMIDADRAYLDDLQEDLDQARLEFETLFWDPVNQYYKFGTAGPFATNIFIDAFYADNRAAVLGLEPLVDPNRHRLYWQNHAHKLLTRDAKGNLSGAAVLGTTDQQSGSGSVNTGSIYSGASDIVRTGRRVGDRKLVRTGIKMGLGVAHQSYYELENSFPFNVPNFYNDENPTSYTYPAYSQVMAIWDLMDAIEPLRTR